MGVLSNISWSGILDALLDNWRLTGGAVALGVVAIELVRSLRSWSRLRHIGGPPLAGFTNLWMIRAVVGGRSHWILKETTDKYGMSGQLLSSCALPPSPSRTCNAPAACDQEQPSNRTVISRMQSIFRVSVTKRRSTNSISTRQDLLPASAPMSSSPATRRCSGAYSPCAALTSGPTGISPWPSTQPATTCCRSGTTSYTTSSGRRCLRV